MSPNDAAQILALDRTATPGQIDAAFRSQRSALEEKLGRAPTEGLKQKYRAAIDAVTTARDTLLSGIDPSALPTAKRPASGATTVAQTVPPSAREAAALPNPVPASHSSDRAAAGRTWVVVAAIVVAAAAGYGYWRWNKSAEPPRPETNVALEKGTDAKAAGAADVHTEEDADEYWKKLPPQEFLEEAYKARAEAEQVVVTYEKEADERLRAYRSSPHRPAIWRAEQWARSRNLTFAAGEIRKGLAPDASLPQQLREMEGLVKSGDKAAFDARREEFRNMVTEFSVLHGIQWHNLVYLTDVEIKTDPAGLEWSIETKFDGENILVVTGRTPVDQDMFVGTGTGMLRIKCPGKPDYVKEQDGIAHPYGGIVEEVSFK